MARRYLPFALLAGAALVAFAARASAQPAKGYADKPTADQLAFFEKKIRPALVEHCYKCHSAEGDKVKGGLYLDTREATRRGGDSGPIIQAGNPARSKLMLSLNHKNADTAMPPKGKLPDSVIADFEAWVKMGAPDPRTGDSGTRKIDIEKGKQFWSFKPVVRPDVPRTKFATANEIDAFVRSKLEAQNLTPSPRADKRALIRRVTFDLIGLPPTPEEIEAFVKDDSPEAFEKVVNRLLASPHYGERWGRHWMDVIRYADTAGDNSDYPIPQNYKFRDWIIDAFNRDLPFNDFVRHQLAGDLLPFGSEGDRRAKLIATGYIANTKRFGSYEDERYPWYLTYEDQIDNLGRAFLGVTMGCCRCHDHKFDPLTQADYYALYGFFSSTRYPRPGIELDKVQRDFVPLGSAAEVAEFEKARKAKQDELDARVKALTTEWRAAEKELTALDAKKDDPDHKEKVAALNKRVTELKAQQRVAQAESEKHAKQPVPFETAYAVAEGTTAGKHRVGNARVQLKGDPERLGAEVPRRAPEVLGGSKMPDGASGSGRLHLANWLADAQNPLTARVFVNRVWHWHFGRGIVRTASNFGALGEPPTHPELLDWLASEFVSHDWSTKHLHKLIVLSHTYQQSSADNEAALKRDNGNALWWRFDRRRLDAESVRDALLSTSGALDRVPGGAHPFPEAKTWNFTQHNPFKAVYETNKRSVYLMTQRFARHPFLALFDGADTNASTERRITSTTPLQALYLMNDPFVHSQAKALAARIQKDADTDAAHVRRAYELLFARAPTADEVEAATAYVEKLRAKLSASAAWESLARALYMSNEFVYLD